MSAPAAETSAHPVAAQALQGLEQGRRLFLNTFTHVPDDKLTWTPAPSSKSALRIAAHCAITNFGIASILRGEPSTITSFQELAAIMDAEEAKFTSREQVVQALEASSDAMRDAIGAMTPEQIERNYGAGELEGPAAFYMTLPGLHMCMHSSQIDYLQTMWGDPVPHFAG
jgi:hypothetical protein